MLPQHGLHQRLEVEPVSYQHQLLRRLLQGVETGISRAEQHRQPVGLVLPELTVGEEPPRRTQQLVDFGTAQPSGDQLLGGGSQQVLQPDGALLGLGAVAVGGKVEGDLRGSLVVDQRLQVLR